MLTKDIHIPEIFRNFGPEISNLLSVGDIQLHRCKLSPLLMTCFLMCNSTFGSNFSKCVCSASKQNDVSATLTYGYVSSWVDSGFLGPLTFAKRTAVAWKENVTNYLKNLMM